MFGWAIAQLIDSAERCETNAPIQEAEGNAEQAAHCRQLSHSYRCAIGALERLEAASTVNYH